VKQMPTKGRILRLLFWESTIKCNLTCAHCRRVEMDETCINDLSTDQAKSMVDQLVEVGKEQGFMPILVFSGGEPLCRDDIFELIAYADSKELICALASNGTLIDADVARKIKAAGVRRVSISLDGATADIHNKLRQQEGSFEAAIAGINHLKDAGVEFQINVTVTKFNAHQIDDVFTLAIDLGAAAVHPFMLVPVGCGEEFAEEDMLSAKEYEEMMIQIADKASKIDIDVKVTCGPHYERVVRESGKLEAVSGHPGGHPGGHSSTSKGCLAGLGVLFVGHQGQVFPCGYLPVDCGNITKETISEIWNGNVDLARMRDVDELKGKCGVCGYKGVCGGCRARAYAASGDYMDQEPFCEYVPPKHNK
jgi:radical SAM protein with 4Fe4S-binding SPASM domain